MDQTVGSGLLRGMNARREECRASLVCVGG